MYEIRCLSRRILGVNGVLKTACSRSWSTSDAYRHLSSTVLAKTLDKFKEQLANKARVAVEGSS